MKTGSRGLLVGAVLALMAPAGAQAQSGAPGWWEWALPAVTGGEAIRTSRGDIVVPGQSRIGHERDRRDRRDRARRGGPPFCRNGAGHPVHGRRWCAEKGFGDWRRTGWEDIIFGRRRHDEATLRRGSLIDILGDIVFGRFERQGRRRTGSDEIVGRWVRADAGARVLQLRAGREPLAELTDLDGDGRVDAVLLSGRD